jgi:hypothetical protein
MPENPITDVTNKDHWDEEFFKTESSNCHGDD